MDDKKQAPALTVEMLREAFDRMSKTPMYTPRLHMLSNGGTWCDQCGPKTFYSEQEWNRQHGFRIA